MQRLKIFIISLFVTISISLNVNANEVTYQQVFNDPTNLELNLKFVKQEEEKGNFKQVIATLERLIILYPQDDKLKLYLLNVSIKADTKQRTIVLLRDLQTSDQFSADIKNKLRSLYVQESNAREAARKKKYDWSSYLDLVYSKALHDNVNSLSKSKTFFSSSTVSNYAASEIEGDDVETMISRLGAFKNIDDTSSVFMTYSASKSTQRRATTNETEADSFFINYNKVFEKNIVSAFYSASRTDYKTESDLISQTVNIENRRSIKDNQNILFGTNMGVTSYNQNPSFTSADAQDNDKLGFMLGYEYYFGPQHSVRIKADNSRVASEKNYKSYDSFKTSIDYAKQFSLANFSLSHSIADNGYDVADSFVHSTIVRKDTVNTTSVSFNGDLDKIIKIGAFKNTFYNINYSYIDTTSTLLNNEYKKEILNIGLTKRINF
ncbi:MAG: hypothetical protein MRY23_01830 [Pelagibacteraceae bacterium]|nr:hypothetical protein [Pelagibacteraceae bacterium]MCI5079674.1 hypothetical protein [Pelagibacteraceae bacterium]